MACSAVQKALDGHSSKPQVPVAPPTLAAAAPGHSVPPEMEIGAKVRAWAVHTGFKAHQKTLSKRQQTSDHRGKALISLRSVPDWAPWLFNTILLILKHIYNLARIGSFSWSLPAWKQHLTPYISHPSLSVPLSGVLQFRVHQRWLSVFTNQ